MSSCSALYLNCGRSTRWSREGTFESTALGSSVNVLRASTFGFFEADLAVEDDCFFRLSDFSILRLLSFGSLPRINTNRHFAANKISKGPAQAAFDSHLKSAIADGSAGDLYWGNVCQSGYVLFRSQRPNARCTCWCANERCSQSLVPFFCPAFCVTPAAKRMNLS